MSTPLIDHRFNASRIRLSFMVHLKMHSLFVLHQREDTDWLSFMQFWKQPHELHCVSVVLFWSVYVCVWCHIECRRAYLMCLNIIICSMGFSLRPNNKVNFLLSQFCVKDFGSIQNGAHKQEIWHMSYYNQNQTLVSTCAPHISQGTIFKDYWYIYFFGRIIRILFDLHRALWKQ